VTFSGEPMDCGDEVIVVDGTSDSSTYRVGTNPVLTLTITNTGDLPCLRDVGPKANEIEVTSGGYHVWSSDDCNASDKTKVVTLQPGETVSSSISWSGVLSRKGCPDIKREAKAGRYEVVGRNGKVRSDGTPFALTRD
jgi:phage-related protein